MYNGSGVQGVGVADTADSLAAIQELVFQRRHLTMEMELQVNVLDHGQLEDALGPSR